MPARNGLILLEPRRGSSAVARYHWLDVLYCGRGPGGDPGSQQTSAADFPQLRLLLGRQVILEAYHQADLSALDLPLNVQHLVELRQRLLLVHLLLLQQGNQRLHLVLQLPLELGEPGLGLEEFPADGGFLLVRQPDGLLVPHNQIRREKIPGHRIGRTPRMRARAGEVTLRAGRVHNSFLGKGRAGYEQ